MHVLNEAHVLTLQEAGIYTCHELTQHFKGFVLVTNHHAGFSEFGVLLCKLQSCGYKPVLVTSIT